MRPARSSGLSPEADGVQVAFANLGASGGECVEVGVMLGVEVASGEGIGLALGDAADQPGRRVGRGPGRVVGKLAGHFRVYEARRHRERKHAVLRHLRGKQLGEPGQRGFAGWVTGVARIGRQVCE